MNKSELKGFINSRELNDKSPAVILHEMILLPEFMDVAGRLMGADDPAMEQQMLDEAKAADTTQELFRMMRRGIVGPGLRVLREKLLQNDDELTPLVKERVLTTGQDIFIENAAYFLTGCRENTTEWIMQHYNEVKSEYMKSMLCLVLGMRGEPEQIEFLMEEYQRFDRGFADKPYQQGPLVALEDMLTRFYE